MLEISDCNILVMINEAAGPKNPRRNYYLGSGPIKSDPLSRLRCGEVIDSMAASGGTAMSDLIWLSDKQMRRIEPYFPLSHGVPRVDDPNRPSNFNMGRDIPIVFHDSVLSVDDRKVGGRPLKRSKPFSPYPRWE
jgi:hypothetical protein